MENVPQSRRRFLATLTFFCASAGLLWRYLTPVAKRRRSVIARAARRDVPGDGALVFREQRVALLREGDLVYAVGLICTHLGCTVNVAADGFSCPCHGSRFDRRGGVLEGPASRPLPRLESVEHNGTIEVYGT